MREGGVVLAEFFFQSGKRFLRLTIAGDDAKCPIGHFLPAGEPFVRPGKQNRSGQAAFRDALDVPAKHFRLLVLRMADRVHAELAEDQRTFLGEILQPQKVTLEVALIMEINVEAKKIDVLRQQIFRRRKRRVGKENVRIDRAADADEMFDKLNHVPDAEPARHRAGDFVADEITQHCGIAG